MRLLASRSKIWIRKMTAAGAMPLLLGCPWIIAQSPEPTTGSGQSATQVRKAPTHSAVKEDELLRRAAEASGKQEKLLEKSKSKPATEAERPNTKSTLLEHSIILTDGEKFTLIPEGSILHLPEKLQPHVLEKPEGDFTIWPNFLKRNASWLMTKEVTLAMSRGDAEAAKAVFAEVSQENRAVVAVYKGGPIMILEAQEESTEAVDKAKAATPMKKTSLSKSFNQR